MKPKFRFFVNENLPRVNYNVIAEELPLDLSVKRFNPVSLKSPVYLSSHEHPLDLAPTDRHHLHSTHHLVITNGHHNHHHHSQLTHLNNQINHHINQHINHHLNHHHHHHNDRHHHPLNHHHHINHSIHLLQSPILLDSSSSSPPNIVERSTNLWNLNKNKLNSNPQVSDKNADTLHGAKDSHPNQVNLASNNHNGSSDHNQNRNYNLEDEDEDDDDDENENENSKNNGNSINLNGNCTDSTEADDHQTSIHSPASDNNDLILNGVNCSGNNRRTSRPLMGKHVRRGTGASPQILSRLKSILQDKQRLREAGLVPANWKRKKMVKVYS